MQFLQFTHTRWTVLKLLHLSLYVRTNYALIYDINYTWQNRFSLKKAICIFANIFFQFSTTFKRLSDFMTRAVDIFFSNWGKKCHLLSLKKSFLRENKTFKMFLFHCRCSLLVQTWNWETVCLLLLSKYKIYNPSFLKK